MPAFSTRRTSGFATSWELLLLEREKHSKPSSSQWLPSARRNGTSTIMDARNGAMPASNTDAIEQRSRREAKKGRTAVSDYGGEEVGTMSRIWESRERSS